MNENKTKKVSQSIDDEYDETVRRMLNSDKVSPIMRKVLEKEMKKIEERAKAMNEAQETASGVKKKDFWKWFEEEEGGGGSEAAKGESKGAAQESDFTEQVLKQGESAIKALEKELKDGTIPPFLRPVAQQMLEKLKSLQASVQNDAQQEQKKSSSNEESTNEPSEKREEKAKEKPSDSPSEDATAKSSATQSNKASQEDRENASSDGQNNNSSNPNSGDSEIFNIDTIVLFLNRILPF